MNANKTQQLLLKSGAELVYAKGFNNTGIQEILQCAGVPKGSFYFYFKSKEEFGMALIEYYTDMMCSMLRNYLTDASHSPIERIKRFFEGSARYYEQHQFEGGCPIGNLSQEMSCLSEPMRVKLLSALRSMHSVIQQCIKEGQDAGQIDSSLDAGALAVFVFNAWEGSLIDMKVSKSVHPLEICKRMVLDFIQSQ
ncbi:MAG TPA: TetR family transcriptional regulator C-terminal domain-containing protein [Spirochaetota bacterium]|nr:TetR family transcriptional regulator C-terminal domain-containing protein [Spirochaetota bacterium]